MNEKEKKKSATILETFIDREYEYSKVTQYSNSTWPGIGRQYGYEYSVPGTRTQYSVQ